MNVTNRKMFRPRNARNRLNQLGGIMASSPELMQTIQRFELGGDVRPGARPTVMGMGSGDLPNVSQIMDFLGLSSPTETQSSSVEVDPTLAEMQRANDPRFFNRLGANLATLPAAAYDTAVGLPAAAVQNAATAFQYSPFGRALGLSEPGAQQPPYVGSQVAQPALQNIFAENVPLTPEQVAAAAMSQDGADGTSGLRQITDPAEIARLTGQPTPPTETAAVSLPTPSVADEVAAPPTETAAPPTETAAPPTETAAPAPVSTPEIEAAKRGELGPKAQVQAVVAAGTPAEQQDQLKQLMNEFTSKAPQYEGIDKGLALAKIGFAMAAGKSPRALENIANALNQGADTFIKDKQERNAFNRQVQLSALQYGLGEVGKERAEERLRDRAGRKPTIWVASKDGEFNGKPFKKGDNVAVPTSYVEENGVPSGLTNLSLAEAAIRENAVLQKALLDAQKDKKMSVSEYNTTSKRMNESAANFASKKTLEELLRKNILQVTEDKITGVQPAFESLVNRAAGAVGIDMGKEYENLEQYEADMLTVANQLVNELLGEGSKTLSDTDRKLAQEIVGYYSGQGGYIFRDPDVLLSRLQSTLSTTQTAQANALNEMREITEATAGLLFPSGQPVKFQSALSVASPFLNQQQAAQFGLVKGEDNVFRMAK